MGSPYLVTTHRHFCRSCHREVDEDEIMVNEDELSVHLCGTVLDFEGLEVDDMGLAGQDLSTLECGADWFAEQRQLLAALQGTSRGEDVPGVSKKMRQQDAQSLLRDAERSAVTSGADTKHVQARVTVGEGKRRRADESHGRLEEESLEAGGHRTCPER